jgi:hypothetical protein
MYEIGQVYPAAVNTYDQNSNPVDAETVFLTITQPDMTQVTPVVTNPPAVTGQYTWPFPIVQAGRHAVNWQTINPNTAWSDVFDVVAAQSDAIISLADCKQTLSIDAANTDDDDELRAKLRAVTHSIQLYMHTQYVPVQVTEWHNWPAHLIPWERPRLRLGSGSTVLPPGGQAVPIMSFSSLITYGPQNQVVTTYDTVNSMTVDRETGLVTVFNGPPLAGRMQAIWTAGMTVIPGNVIEGSKVLLQALWESRRGPGGLNGVIGPEEMADFRHYTGMPRKVMELLGQPRPVVF